MKQLTIFVLAYLFLCTYDANGFLRASETKKDSFFAYEDERQEDAQVRLSEEYSVSNDLSAPIIKLDPSSSNVAIDSALGKGLFSKLLLSDEADGPNQTLLLLRYLETQVNLGACAPASAVTVLNAMNYKRPFDPTYTPYIGEGYAFWTQTAFAFDPCVRKILGGHVYGETLDDFASVLKCLGLKVEVHHGDNTETFATSLRGHLEEKHFVIANFERSAIHQKAGGHFSPLGGFVEGYFLLLDVARYKYAPIFVPSADLIQAMSTKDAQSLKTRGFVAIWKK